MMHNLAVVPDALDTSCVDWALLTARRTPPR